MGPIWSAYLFPCLCAYLACIGFTLLFNIHGPERPLFSAGGALGWLVYLLGGSGIPAAFLAAVCIGLYAETLSRIRKCPVTGCLVIALLPLVPGGGIYRAMRWCIAGETDLFLETLLDTFGMAIALAVGSMLSSSLFRAARAVLQRKHSA